MRPRWSFGRSWLLFFGALVVVIIFYFWRLGALTTGLGPEEFFSAQNNHSFRQIIKNGVNAPYYLVQHAIDKLLPNHIFALRLASVLFALVIFFCLFSWLRSWFGKTTATFITLIFISTPWLILTSRSATPDIMFLWPVVLIYVFRWLTKSDRFAGWFFILFCLVLAITLYVPGMIWLLVAAGIVMHRSLRTILQSKPMAYLTFGLLLIILASVPLIAAVVNEPSRLKTLFLFPDKWPSVLEAIKATAWSFLSLFVELRSHIDITLDKLPIFNIMQTALVVIGVYALSAASRRIVYLMAGMLLFATLAAGINHNLHLINIGLPAVAVFLAAGLRYLYLEWRRVFPLNPLPYALAISLISLVAFFQLLYGLRYSLIAWPHSQETRTTYVLK